MVDFLHEISLKFLSISLFLCVSQSLTCIRSFDGGTGAMTTIETCSPGERCITRIREFYPHIVSQECGKCNAKDEFVVAIESFGTEQERLLKKQRKLDGLDPSCGTFRSATDVGTTEGNFECCCSTDYCNSHQSTVFQLTETYRQLTIANETDQVCPTLFWNLNMKIDEDIDGTVLLEPCDHDAMRNCVINFVYSETMKSLLFAHSYCGRKMKPEEVKEDSNTKSSQEVWNSSLNALLYIASRYVMEYGSNAVIHEQEYNEDEDELQMEKYLNSHPFYAGIVTVLTFLLLATVLTWKYTFESSVSQYVISEGTIIKNHSGKLTQLMRNRTQTNNDMAKKRRRSKRSKSESLSQKTQKDATVSLFVDDTTQQDKSL